MLTQSLLSHVAVEALTQVDAILTRRSNQAALLPRPVLVMPDRQEQPRLARALLRAQLGGRTLEPSSRARHRRALAAAASRRGIVAELVSVGGLVRTASHVGLHLAETTTRGG